MANLTGASVDLELATRVLGPNSGEEAAALTTESVIEAVAAYFQLTPAAMASQRRDRHAAMARHVASFLLREELHKSLDSIGSALGGRNHATVLNSLRKVKQELTQGTAYGSAISNLQHTLHTSTPPPKSN
jgi:chromosomal replication initiator protein